MKTLLISITLICFNTYGQNDNFTINMERTTFHSEILEMDKSYQVYLPESYNYSEEGNYPVAYLIDGDYNFYYQTGIIESLSNISEKIPELIVVAICDNGNEGYRKDCTVASTTNPEGNTHKFMQYIENELKPRIKEAYRVSPYELLIGHSLGGLLTSNIFIQNQTSFSSYIAIDPSYWWDDYAIVTELDTLLKHTENLDSELFISLADSKQMGVHEFVGVLEKYLPESHMWTFKYYENENHGSVGIVSIRDGLLKIFEDWELTREGFYDIATSKEIIAYYKNLSTQYETKLRLPPNLLSNIVYYFYSKGSPEDLVFLKNEIIENFPSSIDDFHSKLGDNLVNSKRYVEANELLKPFCLTNPKAFKSFASLAKLYFARGDIKTAQKYAETSISIAKELHVRQWQLNELESLLYKLNKK